MSTRKKIGIYLILFIIISYSLVLGLGSSSFAAYVYLKSLLPSSLEKKEGKLAQYISGSKIIPDQSYLKLKVPINHAYLGVDTELSNSGIRRFEELTQKKFAIVHFYTFWGGEAPYFDKTEASKFWVDDKVLLISWNPSKSLRTDPVNQPKYRLKRIIRGDFDPYIDKWISDLKSWRRPIVIRFAPEMNGDWVPWGILHNSPTDYKRAYRYIVDKFNRAGVVNVSWMWSPNETDGENLMDWYPGDDYVDWIGLSGFNWGNNKTEVWRSLTEIYQDSFKQLADTNKPISLVELSSVEDKNNPIRKAKWIADSYKTIQNKYPNVKMVVWANISSHNNHWEVNTSTPAIRSFRSSINNPYYLKHVEVFRP